MITVFYDGKCGLCAKEINHYREIAPKGLFEWHDVTESLGMLEPLGISLPTALKRLHAMDDKGNLHIGVNAFILIWKAIPTWKLLGHLLALPGIKHLAEMAYSGFADWKFKRTRHCQIAARDEL